MSLIQQKTSADFLKEKRLKFIIGALQFELTKILTSCVITERYPATTISFNFRIVEMDSDIIQSLVNCAAVALFNSNIECRFIPVGITLMIKSTEGKQSKSKKNLGEWIQIDPNMAQLKSVNTFSHKATMVLNPNNDELVSTTLVSLGKF